METKILLFINHNNSLKHNTICTDLQSVVDIIKELRDEGNLNDNIPTVDFLKIHLENEDDYFQIFSNQTWFHIQYFPVFNKK